MARNKFDIDEELDVKFDFKQVRRLLGYLKPYKGKVASTVLLMIASSRALRTAVKVAIDEEYRRATRAGWSSCRDIRRTLVFAPFAKCRIRTMSQMKQSVITV